MATKVSKNGNVYNVPTVKSTYLSKGEKVLLKAMVSSQIDALKASAAQSMNPTDLALIGQLLELLAKLEK